jgi:LytTr DNA-binding domain
LVWYGQTPNDRTAAPRQTSLRKKAEFLREMTEYPVHAAPMARTLRSQLSGFGVAAVAALVLAVTGALGTDEAGFGTRLIFWLIVMLAGAMIGMGVTTVMKAWGGLAQHRWAEALLTALMLALPQTLVVIATRSLLFDLQMPSSGGTVLMFGFVLFITVIMVALDYALYRPVQANGASNDPIQPTPTADPAERFRERLPPGMRANRLLALEAEDHYLRVHTAGGSTLILLRLADAVAELEGLEGAQTHRSWWVARAAVVGAERGVGRAALELENGQKVPVSRSYYKAIAAAGWLR